MLIRPRNLEIRTLFRTTSIAWPDIQAIEIESNPSATVQSNVPREIVAVYDRQGRKVVLPHLDSRTLPGFHDDVAGLRALWEHGRGADWMPIPEVTAEVAKGHQVADRYRALMLAMVAALVTFCFLCLVLVIVAVNFLSDPTTSTDAVLPVGFGLCGIGAASAFLITFRRALNHRRM